MLTVEVIVQYVYILVAVLWVTVSVMVEVVCCTSRGPWVMMVGEYCNGNSNICSSIRTGSISSFSISISRVNSISSSLLTMSLQWKLVQTFLQLHLVWSLYIFNRRYFPTVIYTQLYTYSYIHTIIYTQLYTYSYIVWSDLAPPCCLVYILCACALVLCCAVGGVALPAGGRVKYSGEFKYTTDI